MEQSLSCLVTVFAWNRQTWFGKRTAAFCQDGENQVCRHAGQRWLIYCAVAIARWYRPGAPSQLYDCVDDSSPQSKQPQTDDHSVRHVDSICLSIFFETRAGAHGDVTSAMGGCTVHCSLFVCPAAFTLRGVLRSAVQYCAELRGTALIMQVTRSKAVNIYLL